MHCGPGAPPFAPHVTISKPLHSLTVKQRQRLVAQGQQLLQSFVNSRCGSGNGRCDAVEYRSRTPSSDTMSDVSAVARLEAEVAVQADTIRKLHQDNDRLRAQLAKCTCRCGQARDLARVVATEKDFKAVVPPVTVSMPVSGTEMDQMAATIANQAAEIARLHEKLKAYQVHVKQLMSTQSPTSVQSTSGTLDCCPQKTKRIEAQQRIIEEKCELLRGLRESLSATTQQLTIVQAEYADLVKVREGLMHTVTQLTKRIAELNRGQPPPLSQPDPQPDSSGLVSYVSSWFSTWR